MTYKYSGKLLLGNTRDLETDSEQTAVIHILMNNVTRPQRSRGEYPHTNICLTSFYYSKDSNLTQREIIYMKESLDKVHKQPLKERWTQIYLLPKAGIWHGRFESSTVNWCLFQNQKKKKKRIIFSSISPFPPKKKKNGAKFNVV